MSRNSTQGETRVQLEPARDPSLRALLGASSLGELTRALRNSVIKYVLTGAADSTTTPRGVLTATAGATIVTEKENQQPNGLLFPANVDKMWSALLPDSRANSVWVASPSLASQLLNLRDPMSYIRLFQPSGAGGTLYGRPLVFSQFMPTTGEQGDLALIDWAGYFLPVRANVRAQASIHLAFDKDMVALKATMRVGGQPGHVAKVTLADGTVLSYAAILGARKSS